ncbi:MAG: hypothetical protein M1338_04395 [Patescibacteria group bacterium]|nr:hypothetical protein [Patescibacteria group bacterium]
MLALKNDTIFFKGNALIEVDNTPISQGKKYYFLAITVNHEDVLVKIANINKNVVKLSVKAGDADAATFLVVNFNPIYQSITNDATVIFSSLNLKPQIIQKT